MIEPILNSVSTLDSMAFLFRRFVSLACCGGGSCGGAGGGASGGSGGGSGGGFTVHSFHRWCAFSLIGAQGGGLLELVLRGLLSAPSWCSGLQSRAAAAMVPVSEAPSRRAAGPIHSCGIRSKVVVISSRASIARMALRLSSRSLSWLPGLAPVAAGVGTSSPAVPARPRSLLFSPVVTPGCMTMRATLCPKAG